MFPKLPENLSTLGSRELKALRLEFAKAVKAAGPASGLTDEQKAEVLAARTTMADLATMADDAAEAEAAQAEEDATAAAEAEAAALAEQAAADEAAAAAAAEQAAAETPAETPAEGTEVPAPETGAGAAPVVRTGVPATATPAPAGTLAPAQLIDVTSGGGATFGDWTEVSAAFIDQMENLSPTAQSRQVVARVRGSFTDEQILSSDPIDNLGKFAATGGYGRFDETPGELTAAICSPIQNTYNLACWNVDRRPVRGSLPVYRTEDTKRGGITVYPSPTLEDVEGGYGIWTQDDDDNPAAIKTCTDITCATPIEYRWYAIYRCITIKNMMAMTFPELVEAYLNRLSAAQARLAEKTMLEQMANSADTISAHELGYNATVAIGTNLLNYLALYQEQQRWDTPGMIAWMPRWIVWALKADMMRRRRTDGGRISVPSDADVEQLFREVGVTPVFFLDSPSWVTPLPRLQTNNVLGWFPANLEVLVAPVGKFRAFDEGNLTVGIQPNNVYRINDDLLKNQFRMFWESTEGVLDTNTCPAHIIEFNNLCFNGQQIADLVINCQGGDEVGPAS